MTKPLWLVFTLIEQQIDVVEQELASFAHRDGAWLVPGGEIRRLRENPRIAEDTAADENTARRRSSSVQRSAQAPHNRRCLTPECCKSLGDLTD